MKILILSGISGSGKSTAIKALEDIGFFCVDNLPPQLIPAFIDLCTNSETKIDEIALVVDIRIPDIKTLQNFSDFIDSLSSDPLRIELVFLNANDEVIVKRYKETRRKHPLSKDGNILNGIKKERKILSSIKDISDHLIDTSSYNVHQLRDHIQNIFDSKKDEGMSINFLSFGFKHGYPINSDIVLDVRFLPNPYFNEKLKNLDGNNKKIRDFVLSSKETEKFIEKVTGLLTFLIPLYQREGKSYLNLAIGCTGGRHRSVVVINEIAKKFNNKKKSITHRDINS